MRNILKSWKTTLLGLASIGYAVKVFVTTGDFTQAYAAIVAGVGLIFSKDADQTGVEK
jgi:hypothetical protein